MGCCNIYGSGINYNEALTGVSNVWSQRQYFPGGLDVTGMANAPTPAPPDYRQLLVAPDGTVLIGTSSAAGGLIPHDIGGPYHTGSILDSMGPQFVLLDGTRPLTGNWSVAPGVTIDGIDISVLGGRQIIGGAGLINNGPSIIGQSNVVLDVGAGAGILVNTDSVGVDQGYSFNWSVRHFFNQGIIMPSGANIQWGADGDPNRVLLFGADGSLNISGTAALRSTDYIAGLRGWDISPGGSAEFHNVLVRGALKTTVFTYNSINATAGQQVILKSASTLRADFTVGAGLGYDTAGQTVNIDVRDIEGVPHAPFAEVGDILRIKDGLAGDTWFGIESITDQTTHFRFTCRLLAGARGVTYYTGWAIVNYGTAGWGGIVLRSDNPPQTPYMLMFDHQGAFSANSSTGSLNLRARMVAGNLNGKYYYVAPTYGVAIGDQESTWQSWDSVNGLRMMNVGTQLARWDIAGNITIGPPTSANLYLSAGQVLLRQASNNVIALYATVQAEGVVARFEGAIGLGAAGGIWQGSSGTFATPVTGYRLRRASNGTGVWETWLGSARQVWIEEDMSLRAGAGDVVVNNNGITIAAREEYAVFPNNPRAVGWFIAGDGTPVMTLTANRIAGIPGIPATVNTGFLHTHGPHSHMRISVGVPTNGTDPNFNVIPNIWMQSGPAAQDGSIFLQVGASIFSMDRNFMRFYGAVDFSAAVVTWGGGTVSFPNLSITNTITAPNANFTNLTAGVGNITALTATGATVMGTTSLQGAVNSPAIDTKISTAFTTTFTGGWVQIAVSDPTNYTSAAYFKRVGDLVWFRGHVYKRNTGGTNLVGILPFAANGAVYVNGASGNFVVQGNQLLCRQTAIGSYPFDSAFDPVGESNSFWVFAYIFLN